MIFVIPMAGDSRRFFEAGFDQPKFRLDAYGASLFDHAVGSFAAYFASDSFLFVVRDADTADFVQKRGAELGIAHFLTVILDGPTSGQAETVLIGLDRALVDDDEPIAIFNIDTFRPDYRKPPLTFDAGCAGYLEVFRGEGAGWSFVAVDDDFAAAEVAEKLPISDLCCTGLYHFRRAGDFRWAYRNPSPPRSEAERRERYVAPLYNPLIAAGHHIGIELIAADEVIFCGTPDQYRTLLDSPEMARRLLP